MIRKAWRGALIGCGYFAANQLNAWRWIPGVDMIAVCDLDVVKANAMGNAFGVHSVYDNALTMLEQEKLDFVDIATTVGSHRPLVELCAAHEKLIICQKPFAETLGDADAMVAAASEAKVQLLIHENFRWQRPFREIAERVSAGIIGEPKLMRLTFRHAYDIYGSQPYLAETRRLALMDIGSHLFDLARVLLGEVTSIHCRTQQLNPIVRGEDCFIASLQHENGAISLIESSFFSKIEPQIFPQTLALLEGTSGSLELKTDYRLVEYCTGVVCESVVEPETPSWGSKPWHCVQDSVINFQRHVLDVLEDRAEPQPSGAHNRDTLALVLAAYQSAEQDRVITFPRNKVSLK